MSNRMYPKESHRMRNVLVLGTAAAVGMTALNVYRDNECAAQILQRDYTGAIGCAWDVDTSPGSSAEVSDLPLLSEDLVTEDLNLTFGTISMQMGGEAKIAYNGPWYKDVPIIDDNTMYYNKGNKKTTEVVAALYLRVGEDYKTALDLNDQPAGDGKSKVKVHLDVAEDGKTYDNVVIDAGRLDFLLPHIPFVPENYHWSNKDWSTGPFGDEEEKAYKTAISDLIIHAAMAQSCPEDELVMEKVKEVVKNVVRGALSADPAKKPLVEEAFASQGKVMISLQSAQERQDHYRKVYEDKRKGYEDGTAFADEIDTSKSSFEVGDIPVRTCKISEGLPQ